MNTIFLLTLLAASSAPLPVPVDPPVQKAVLPTPARKRKRTKPNRKARRATASMARKARKK
jgi:hypothetical protein